MTTNGYLLEKYAENIVENNCQAINISIHGNEEDHNQVTRVPDSFRKVISGLQKLDLAKREHNVSLPLIAVNCAILGVALFVQERDYQTISEVSVYAVGSGIGWFLAITAIAAIKEKIQYSAIPPGLRGLGISFIITGLMAIAFMGFMGIKI